MSSWIRYETLPRMTLEEFAKVHGLTLTVKEMDSSLVHEGRARWIARFDNSETKRYSGDPMLSSEYGDGHSELAAIMDYCSKISRKVLVLNAMRPDRKEIPVPVIEPPYGLST